MSESFGATFRQSKSVDFGRQLASWVYKPQKSNKFVFYILGLLGALAIFIFTYGKSLAPWLDKIPDYAVYLIFLVFGPAAKFFRSMGKDQEWTLYEHGFVVRYIDKNKGGSASTSGDWQDYKSATYTTDLVVLIPSSPARKKIKVHVAQNVMEIYSLCRERISIAQTAKLQNLMRRPTTPNTPEQRRVARMQHRTKHRSRTSNW
jgi:hypothetical protein